MKTISVNVSEPVYRDIADYAKRNDRTTAELIREAMEMFCRERIRPRASLLTLKALDLGKVLVPLTGQDDLLEEMLDDPRP